jgi:hypothetical protein
MLRTCLEHKGGKKTMPKLSGSAVSDDSKMRFRWCLRGPTVVREHYEGDSGGLFKKEKLKSLFRMADFRK